ncbi:YflJ family protein [Bacillus sp. XF8]|nr:YflJ family protein [Bacillus sp. XF8]MBO1581568.1 YflJ family protein [Bacillus sp. XF8]
MYYGTKGWYVAELKKLGVRYHEGRKLESYRAHVLRNLLAEQQEKTEDK